ncbi:hypothetical protein GGR56DRAFT_397350 [Xylariaceae sp. FL0804]|nr:hypothetical protein GGR56DRAFT_397350 [Xylariaceae sp. FL0804]
MPDLETPSHIKNRESKGHKDSVELIACAQYFLLNDMREQIKQCLGDNLFHEVLLFRMPRNSLNMALKDLDYQNLQRVEGLLKGIIRVYDLPGLEDIWHLFIYYVERPEFRILWDKKWMQLMQFSPNFHFDTLKAFHEIIATTKLSWLPI